MVQDTSELKEKIISLFKREGPSLPVHVAKETGLNILFASAFLSELIAEKKIKISNMKVGNSPVYFIPGQEPMLEKFSEYLKSKEKEAFLFLKEKKFLKDSEQEPAIRVALRAIKDFAVPFKKNEEIYWRYFKIHETEFKPKEIKKSGLEIKSPEIKKQEIEKMNLKSQEIKTKEPIKNKEGDSNLDIFKKLKVPNKKIRTKIVSKKHNNKFFNKVKEFLSEKDAEILEIISAINSELILKIRADNREKILIAYNKKRITEKDIVDAHKKSQKFNLPFLVMGLGRISKKLDELIEAIKVLSDIEKIE